MSTQNTTLNHPGYDPLPLLEFVASLLKCRYDSELALKLDVCGSSLSRVRSRRDGVSDHLLLRMHEATGTPVAELRRLMGVPSTVMLAKQLGPVPVHPDIIDKINALPRYYKGQDGQMHAGAVGRNSYVLDGDLMDLLQVGTSARVVRARLVRREAVA